MKNRYKDFLLVCIVLGILAFISMTALQSSGVSKPEYTVFSTGDNGLSLLYDSFKQMGYPVETGYQRIETQSSVNDIHIVTQPSPLYFDYDDLSDMLRWVYAGGRLIYLDDDNLYRLDTILAGMPSYSDGYFTLYRYGLGEVLTGGASAVLNKRLMNDRTGGKTLLSLIGYWRDYEKVVFSEYYHGYHGISNEQGDQLWHDMPDWAKIILYQFILVIFFLLLMLGKRFGRPVTYYEEIERDENELVMAVSAMYQNAGFGEMILRNYYRYFISQCERFFQQPEHYVQENLVTLWQANKLPHPDILQETIAHMARGGVYNTRKRKQKKQFLQVIEHITVLTRIVKER